MAWYHHCFPLTHCKRARRRERGKEKEVERGREEVEGCREEQRGKPERGGQRRMKIENNWQQMSYIAVCYPLEILCCQQHPYRDTTSILA